MAAKKERYMLSDSSGAVGSDYEVRTSSWNIFVIVDFGGGGLIN